MPSAREGGLHVSVRGGEEDDEIEHLSLFTADLCEDERYPVCFQLSK